MKVKRERKREEKRASSARSQWGKTGSHGDGGSSPIQVWIIAQTGGMLLGKADVPIILLAGLLDPVASIICCAAILQI